MTSLLEGDSRWHEAEPFEAQIRDREPDSRVCERRVEIEHAMKVAYGLFEALLVVDAAERGRLHALLKF